MSYYKNSEEVSNAAKKGWINLKNDKDKYEKCRKKKYNNMKTISSEEQRRRANIFLEKYIRSQWYFPVKKIVFA